ncbi:hypothetical protein CERSUDRAFT_93408 [Gelatoporia subvermispora B]|uniref:Uncharacterized protein n=1 Tax=Ceriporiopsis subvermispora (strain B) TaxID=914234 RepID=M2RLN0_CERS8|nr:hypothetical protein CERSUDRAFT_93408 [Gelatoporia subvermispora B]
MSANRGTRYKEKFQALREKYDQTVATHEQYKRELELANDKLKRLQEECNLLLDAVDIAVPAQPSLLHYLSQDPIPPQYHSYTVPFAPAPAAPQPAPPQPAPPQAPPRTRSRRSSQQHVNGNGHGNGIPQRVKPGTVFKD